MIVDAIFLVLYGIVYALTSPLRAFDDVSLPTLISSAISTASGYLSSVNAVLPVSTLLQAMAVVFSIELIVISYKIIMWVVRKIPTIS